MLYSKISCNPEDSLAKMYDYGVYSALGTDFNALITITKRGRLQIDARRLYTDTYDFTDMEVILNNIVSADSDVIGLDRTEKFSCRYKNHVVDVVLSPIRYYDNYYVYSVLGKRESDWEEKELSIISFITKVTYENVLLDKKIMKERLYLKTVFDSISSLISTVDRDLNIISINKELSEFFGLGEQCIGLSLENVFKDDKGHTPPLITKIIGQCEKVLEGETVETFDGEISFGEKNRKKHLNVSLSPIKEPDGAINGIIVVGNDISQLKLYEKENEMLQKYAFMGEIGADIAHDIKNPLMSISSVAQLMLKQDDMKQYNEYMEAIMESVGRIDQSVEQILSYTRLSTEIKEGKTDINAVLNECIHATKLFCATKHITIRKFFGENIPLLNASILKLQQLFMNILTNAAQSINDVGSIDIITQFDTRDKQIVVIIKDTGGGMEDPEAAFEMFYTTKKNGTGLGLSIVKKVLDELNGQCNVRTVPGKGTTFYIRIPY